MLKTLKTLLGRLCPSEPVRCDTAAGADSWLCDPLSHPQLQSMSQRQLADLPFDPRRIHRHC